MCAKICCFARNVSGFRSGRMRYRFAGNNAGRGWQVLEMGGNFIAVNQRFTIDGSDALERHLWELCEQVARGVNSIVGETKIDGLVLGGGYGRGEGGVLNTPAGDKPYNDLEFYVFLRGARLWNEREFTSKLAELGNRLSPQAGLHVEFKVDSLERFRRSPTSMFSYDLVARHRVVLGEPKLFRDCEHHLDARQIPLAEATRLLFNRFTGLLLCRELLTQPTLKMEDADFVGRNLAKAQLAIGDAILAVAGQYHWSCSERHSRLQQLGKEKGLTAAGSRNQESPRSIKLPESFQTILNYHANGVTFKLHPRRILKGTDDFKAEHDAVCAIGAQLWLWVEQYRLNRTFNSIEDYALSLDTKCPETAAWRNYLLNLKTFGPRAALNSLAWRYPRERLMHSLPLLLWHEQGLANPDVATHLQRQLHTTAADWRSLVGAYKQIWPSYG
jgi:hypothetical protein